MKKNVLLVAAGVVMGAAAAVAVFLGRDKIVETEKKAYERLRNAIDAARDKKSKEE